LILKTQETKLVHKSAELKIVTDGSAEREADAKNDADFADAHEAVHSQIMPIVRPYRPADFEAALALWEEGKLKPYTAAEIERLINSGGGALIAELPDGTGILQAVGVLLWSHNGQVALLWRLSVSTSHRRRGIARTLLHQVEADVRTAGFPGMLLLTNRANAGAKTLYTQEGWRHREQSEFWVKPLPVQETPVTETEHADFEPCK